MTNITSSLCEDLLMTILVQLFLELKMFQTKLVQKI